MTTPRPVQAGRGAAGSVAEAAIDFIESAVMIPQPTSPAVRRLATGPARGRSISTSASSRRVADFESIADPPCVPVPATPLPTLPQTQSTHALTAAMAAGDAAAVETFYRRYFDTMVGMARRAVPARARDEAFALDVVHDATLRIVRCIRPMETEAHVLNWTRLVVQSCALDRLRQEKRRRQRESVRSIDASAFVVAEETSEQADWLAREIARLEPTLAELLRRRFHDGWTLARIAATLRTTTGQVDGRLRRAIATLRARAQEVFDA